MQAQVGDKIVIRGHRAGDPDRDAEILEVRGSEGGPPYIVKWVDGHETFFYPGSDAEIVHSAHSAQPEGGKP